MCSLKTLQRKSSTARKPESGQSKSGTFAASQRPSSPPIRAANTEGSSTRVPGPAAAAHETPSHPTSHARRADALTVNSPDQIPRDRLQAADRPERFIAPQVVLASKGPVRSGSQPTGLAAARARGRKGGRRKKLGEKQCAVAVDLYRQKEHTIDEVCNAVGISRPTLYKYGSSAEFVGVD